MPTHPIGDIQLFYEIVGTGPPVLLIHGLGSSARDWEFQTPVLDQEFTVISADLRGLTKTANSKILPTASPVSAVGACV
ncbi:hypothetical protein EKD04_005345 [Chloroflexales bacterium ZM16-3]|nr:hypothetical protein [Chloroflexales bacterium ZM16-3]